MLLEFTGCLQTQNTLLPMALLLISFKAVANVPILGYLFKIGH